MAKNIDEKIEENPYASPRNESDELFGKLSPTFYEYLVPGIGIHRYVDRTVSSLSSDNLNSDKEFYKNLIVKNGVLLLSIHIFETISLGIGLGHIAYQILSK